MKVIKLILQEAPDSYSMRYLEVLRYPKISAVAINKLDTINHPEDKEDTSEFYDLQRLRLGEYEERFYIKNKDLDALQSILSGFVNKAEVDLLEHLLQYPSGMIKKYIKVLLKDKKETK